MQIYLLTFPNNKKYVGITSKTAAERFTAHGYVTHSKRRPVNHAIHKYGKENVTVTVLATLNPTAEDYDICWRMLCSAEQRMIAHYDTFGENGYNMTLGGEGTVKIKLPSSERAMWDRELQLGRQTRYYAANRDKIIARSVARQRENKDEKAAKDKARYAQNKVGVLAKQKADRASKVWTEEENIARKKRNRDYYARRAKEPEFREKHKQCSAKYLEENREEVNRRRREKTLTLKTQNALMEEI